jgi:hypothetical protein
MQAIRTRYHGPSNVKGSRISAVSAGGKRIMVGCVDNLSVEENHARACRLLCDKMEWKWPMTSGGFGGDQYWVDASEMVNALKIAEATIDRLCDTGAKIMSVQGTKTVIRDALANAYLNR